MKLIKSGIISRSKLYHKKIYKESTPRPTQKDFNKIFDDVESKGQLKPVCVDDDWNLIDGYTRFEILDKQRIDDIKYEQYLFESDDEKLDYIDSVNVKRRHLGPWQRFEASLPTYNYEKKEAKTRQKTGTLQSQDVKGTAIEKAAKEADMSPKTYERDLDIKEKATIDQIKKLKTGDTKIKTLHTQLTRKQRNKPTVSLPKGEFDIILCDVPIAFDDKGVAFKGKAMPVPLELFSSIISEKRTKHSKKPESIYDIIEKMYPGRNYLELFGRNKRKGWTVFGNEVKEEVITVA